MKIEEVFEEMKKMNLNGEITLEDEKIIWKKSTSIEVEIIIEQPPLTYVAVITPYYIENGIKQRIDIQNEMGEINLFQNIKEENETIYVKEIKKNRILWFFKDEYEKMKEKKKAKYIVIDKE